MSIRWREAVAFVSLMLLVGFALGGLWSPDPVVSLSRGLAVVGAATVSWLTLASWPQSVRCRVLGAALAGWTAEVLRWVVDAPLLWNLTQGGSAVEFLSQTVQGARAKLGQIAAWPTSWHSSLLFRMCVGSIIGIAVSVCALLLSRQQTQKAHRGDRGAAAEAGSGRTD